MGKVRRWCAAPIVATMMAVSMTGCADDEDSKWRLLGTDALPSNHDDSRMPGISPGTHRASEVSGAAFVTAYFIESGVAGHTGDTTKLKLMADPGCLACAATVGAIEEFHAAGGTQKTDGQAHTVTSIEMLGTTESAGIRYDVTIQVSAGRARKSADDELFEFEGEQQRWLVDVTITNGDWKIAEIGYPDGAEPDLGLRL
ncbi:hypothetical protein BJ980_001060 [Nocardioides daedukensis]|uniref:Lipoprotein n=1 Tax=Nocardioides daedukensis TaxID=634462 RepID=A0A7Y9UPD4_9ACTN|nr:DUF6318 family protein [Nocardioides daedukensis]NYG58137.1 hypothetical protein [Nocardioides daedukensis]